MFKNNLKLVFRSLWSNRLTTIINTVGLALGLSVVVMVMLYTQHEFSYDQWVKDKDNIYRLYREWDSGDRSLYMPSPVVEALNNDIVGVRSAARVLVNTDMLLEWEQEQHRVPVMHSVDSTFFQTFPWEFKYGDAATAFQKLDAVVITERLAKQIFGEQNPIGASLLMETTHLLEVTGVLATPEKPTHLEADLFLFEELSTTAWSGANGYVYVRLNDSADPTQVSSDLYNIASNRIETEYIKRKEPFSKNRLPQWQLQPITDIHLKSSELGENDISNGSYKKLSIIGFLGLMTLLLAIINYINLSTAKITARAEEVGIRKIIGVTRPQLVKQFITEAGIAVGISLMIALGISYFMLPLFNTIVGRSLGITDLFNSSSIMMVTLLTVFVAIGAGVFPAYYFSNLNPGSTLKKQVSRGKSSSFYRNTLVVFQFALSIGLVLFVSITWLQVNYMLDKELGFKDDQIVIFRINQSKTADAFQQKKQQLLNTPGVAAASQMSRTLGAFIPNYKLQIEGQEGFAYVNTLFMDTDWNDAFKVKMQSGRFFSSDFASDTTSGYVVNEAFVKEYGLKNPIGKSIKVSADRKFGQIIGVTENFHYQDLQRSIQPLVLAARLDATWMGTVAIRIKSEDIKRAIPAVAAFWKTLEPDFPVTYEFQDEVFAEQYESYVRFGQSLFYASVFCIFIALLGLFGLTIFSVQHRTKEIGIRKVLGASVAGIVALLSKDFIKLVILAFIIATPIAYYFMAQWLQNFAYHIDIQWWVFALAGISAIGIALLTVSFQSVRAALANPVESLRSE